MVRSPWAIHLGRYCRPPGPNFSGDPGMPGDHKLAQGPIERIQDHQCPGLPKVSGAVLGDEFSPKGVLNLHLGGFEGGHNLVIAPFPCVMSSKLTELTESSPSAPPPSVLCGSGIFSQFSSPSTASSGHFDPSQTYDGYKACHYSFIGKRPCHHTWVPTYDFRRYLWSRKDGPFGKEFPVPDAPTPDGNSGHSHYAEGSDELDGEEVQVFPHSVDHQSSTSFSQPLAN
ncbi:hypothetical protein O181_098610 [Austropuccinia psidii MF-1]|uniref:Uncharacterized protein n=1 Tax=Austropuccinia psidii MF-1 TaxID=1389203 RepID=A0A9Q3JBY4_9BASI|nr:hypothetical protein [Austropuccinia psidii MF-1]